jgi:hypothetical protein
VVHTNNAYVPPTPFITKFSFRSWLPKNDVANRPR